MRRNVFLLVLVVLVTPDGVRGQGAGQDYRIGPKDLIEIRVAEVPELTVERRVLDSGVVDLPLLGFVPVAGSSSLEVRDRISALLTSKYVNQAYVTVNVKEYANRPITVLGGVARPGTLAISGRWTLQQAILAMGGTSAAAGKRISVLRSAENGLSDRLELSSDELFLKSNLVWNIPIVAGDIVHVSTRQPVTVFCIGEFKTPGAVQFQSEDRITLLTLVAKTGGFSDRAKKSSIRIMRTEENGKKSELVVNYNRVLAGKDPDVSLMPDDVVIVKESLF